MKIMMTVYFFFFLAARNLRTKLEVTSGSPGLSCINFISYLIFRHIFVVWPLFSFYHFEWGSLKKQIKSTISMPSWQGEGFGVPLWATPRFSHLLSVWVSQTLSNITAILVRLSLLISIFVSQVQRSTCSVFNQDNILCWYSDSHLLTFLCITSTIP